MQRAAKIIGIDPAELGGRGKMREVVRARELLAALGVERYGLRVKDLAESLGKHPVTVTGWVMRGVRQRNEDGRVAARFEELDAALSEP